VELGTEDAIAGSRERDVLQAALQQFYELRGAPPEIHAPVEPEDREALESWLSDRAGHRVRIVVPQRGEKRALVDLANRNAALAYQTRFNQTTAAQYDALETLQAVLALPAIPRRIECFDISTIQGSETVASMVVCEDGRMRRAEYRKYRIRGGLGLGARGLGLGARGSGLGARGSGLGARGSAFGTRHSEGGGASSPESRTPSPDDFAAMHEVVLRRYRKLLEQGGPFPDLVLIDGGKGQLTAAYTALEELGLANLVAVGIAKKEELIYTRDRVDPIALAPHDPALLLLQRIRDEAHRFAVTFHRRARTIRDLRSELDQVPGIGPRRRRTLLTTFGSVAGVRRATREELAAAVGPKAADVILAFFASRP
jgi:excinuclease ABC subunit C